MGVSRQESWSGLPFPTPGDLPDPEIEPESFPSPALAGGFFIMCATGEAQQECMFLTKGNPFPSFPGQGRKAFYNENIIKIL